jgi:hypothetical protein
VLKRGALIASLGVAVVAGCGGGDDEKKESQPAGSQTFTATSTATTPSGDTRSAPEQPIAERDGSIDQHSVKLQIVELKRSGQTSELTIRLVATGDTDGAQVAQTFDDGISQNLKSTGDPPPETGTLDGISLIDSQNRKRYLAGRDEDGSCACDKDLSNAFVAADAPLVLSATFAAPPADVKAMDVVVPRFGTFKDVPLS